MMRYRSGSEENLRWDWGAFVRLAFFTICPGSGLLSPFRFSRIDRLNITALRFTCRIRVRIV
jgi:hypothetical protein